MDTKDSLTSWRILFASVLLMFLETGIIKSLGVLLPDIREQFSTQTWLIGFAISMTPGFGAVVCLFIGPITNFVEPRVAAIVCALLGSFGLFLASIAKTIGTVVIAFVITGLCTGTFAVAAAALPDYFSKHIKAAIAVFFCGKSLGMIVMPLITQYLVNTYGWRGTTLLLSGMSLHYVVFGALINPNSQGYKKIPKTKYPSHAFSGWKKYLDLSLFSNHSFLVLLSITFGTGYCTTGWLIYVVPYVIDLGFTPYKASVVASAGGVANLMGNILWPLLAIFLSNKATLYISVILISVSFLIDPFAGSFHSYGGLILSAIVFGLGVGLKTNTEYIMTSDAVDEDQMTSGMALIFASFGLSSVASGFVSGWLYDRTGSYIISFLALSGVSAVTFIPQLSVDINNGCQSNRKDDEPTLYYARSKENGLSSKE